MPTATNMTHITRGDALGVQWQEKGLQTQIATVTVADTAGADDTFVGPSIPAGHSLVGITLSCTDIDTDGSPTVTLSVGISGTAAKFISASTIGQGGGIARMSVGAALGYSPTSDTPVIVTIADAATAAAEGTLKLAVRTTRTP